MLLLLSIKSKFPISSRENVPSGRQSFTFSSTKRAIYNILPVNKQTSSVILIVFPYVFLNLYTENISYEIYVDMTSMKNIILKSLSKANMHDITFQQFSEPKFRTPKSSGTFNFDIS